MPRSRNLAPSRAPRWALLLIVGALSVNNTQAEPDLPAGDADAGAQTYEAVCQGCHSVSIAPTLRGVVGRPIASVASFTGYSEGLSAKQGATWTKQNLDAFLSDPAGFAPGTLMVQTIPDAQQRANMIAFLEMLPPPRQ